MTWVFGSATEFFGTAICVGDIQVTLENGEQIDCLQKVYPLEQNVAAGFAGNVEVGFSMLAALQQVVREVAVEHGDPANIETALKRFSPFAAKAWRGLDQKLQQGGCEILVAGASPAPDRIYNGEPLVARLRAPSFAVERIPRGAWASIGSGTEIADYRVELERLSSGDGDDALPMEANRPGGFAHTMFLGVLFQVFEMPDQSGISKHFHYIILTAGGYQGGTSNRGFYPPDGPPQSIEMPSVATCWSELVELVEHRTGSAPAWARA
jgi:hypothetical protein